MANAVAAAAGQAIIAHETPNIKNKDGKVVPFVIDGRWGSTTQAAYAALSVKGRMAVEAVVTSAGSSVAALSSEWNKGAKWAGNSAAVQTVGQKVQDSVLTSQLATELRNRGVTDAKVLAVLTSPKLLELEAGIRPGTMVNPAIINPTTSASGPFQYVIGTWNPYAKQVRGANQYTSKAAYQDATMRAAPGSPGDWRTAAAVHAVALVDTLRILTNNRLPVTIATMYTIHNQGAGKGLDYLKGRIGFSSLANLAGQSASAKDLMKSAMA